MKLMQKIKEDLVTARKSRDIVKSNLLSALYSDCLKIGIDDGHRETTDLEVVSVIKKFEKGLNETLRSLRSQVIESKMAVGMTNISTEENPCINQYLTERKILENYLPSQLTREDLEDIIFSLKTTDISTVMKFLKENHPGQYDGKIATDIVKKIDKI